MKYFRQNLVEWKNSVFEDSVWMNRIFAMFFSSHKRSVAVIDHRCCYLSLLLRSLR